MTRGSSNWPGIELRHLFALSAVSQAGSFHGAALLLGYTQSTVSEQIAILERIVGQRLIDRPGGPKQVSLTPAGRILLGHTRAVVDRLQAAEADMRAFSTGEAGTLGVGAYQSASRQILPPLLLRFSAAWPRIDVRLTESADDGDFFPLIRSGELDLTFAIYPIPDGPFEAIELLADPYVLVVLESSPLAARETPLSLHDTVGLRLLGFRQRRSLAPIESHLRARGIDGQIAFHSDDYGTLEALVAAGLGAAIVPRLTVSRSDPRIVVLALEDDLPVRRIALVWHRDRHRSSATEAFIAEARQVCHDLQANTL